MAIRNLQGINNVILSNQSTNQLKVEEVKNKLMFYNKYIMNMSNDIVDLLDTFNYCKEKGFQDIVRKYSKTFQTIGVKDKFLYFQFNDWRKEDTGPYNWYVYTNGYDVWVRINDDESRVSNMANKARFHEDNISGNYVIAPIITPKGYYTCHNSERPLRALQMFADKLKPFVTSFFDEIDNLS